MVEPLQKTHGHGGQDSDADSDQPVHGASPVTGVRWRGKTAIVDVAGDIDLGTSLDFQQSLLAMLDDRPQRVVVNLSRVPYMDSSGVASLVKLLAKANKQGSSVALAELTPRVRSIFEITRLDGIFQIFATEQEALD